MKILNTLSTTKAGVGVTSLAAITTTAAANFLSTSVYAYTVTGNPTITVSNLSAGQRVSISLYCDSTLRTVSWAGITTWLNGVPVLAASKLTMITLFHDGVGVIGVWTTQA